MCIACWQYTQLAVSKCFKHSENITRTVSIKSQNHIKNVFQPILWQYLKQNWWTLCSPTSSQTQFSVLVCGSYKHRLGQESLLFPYILFSFPFFFFKENVSLAVQMKCGPFHFKLIITVWLEKNSQANFTLLAKISVQRKEEFSWLWDHKAVGGTLGWKS